MGYILANNEKKNNEGKKKQKFNWKEIIKKIINRILKAIKVIAKVSMKLGEVIYNYMEKQFGDED